MQTIAVGIDEAGRGPLAGPVVAAAVVLDPQNPIDAIQDSKQLSSSARERLFVEIKEHALDYGIAEASSSEIDQLNILQASLLAMRRAFEQLESRVTVAWIDGNQDPQLPCETHTLIKGDSKRFDIGAASILAKVTRDRLMCQYDADYPEYGFAQHKGYPTQLHLQRLQEVGISPIHRLSFKPVRDCLDNLGLNR